MNLTALAARLRGHGAPGRRRDGRGPDRGQRRVPQPLTTELRRLAQLVLSERGKHWVFRRGIHGRQYGHVEWGDDLNDGFGTADLSEAMARYIAAVDPKAILELLDLVRERDEADAR